jgi:hypothetical protein
MLLSHQAGLRLVDNRCGGARLVDNRCVPCSETEKRIRIQKFRTARERGATANDTRKTMNTHGELAKILVAIIPPQAHAFGDHLG